MAWSYTTGVLTSTGATEASPDSVLDGIAIVQAADLTRGYRNGLVAWVNNTAINFGSSFIIFDIDSTIEFRGTAGIGTGSGGVIHGARSTMVLNKTTGGGFGIFPSGSTFITRRTSPQDPPARIVQKQALRVDYPTFGSVDIANTLAKLSVDGLDYYNAAGGSQTLVSRFYAGATISSVKDLRLYAPVAGSCYLLFYNATYTTLYTESLELFWSENGLVNTVTLEKPTVYRPTAGALGGGIRSANFVVRNPTFLNNCWNGTFSLLGGNAAAPSVASIFYTYTNIIKQGFVAIDGANIRFTRARQSVSGTPTWTAPNALIAATSNSSGTFTAVDLLDTYRSGTSLTDLERFNWSSKIRKYDKRTAGEYVFENRVLYQHSVNMSAGYSEELQMLDVPYLTLTASQAAAITGISISASGTTGGTVTITQNSNNGDLWQYWRQWIAQVGNFDSVDSWTYNGSELNIGAWNVVINGATYTGDMTTTGLITLANGATFVGTRTDANGTVSPPKTVSITGLTAGSRLRVYNNTTATEVVNQIVAGTSYSATYNEGTGYTTGNTLTITATWQSGTSAKLPFTTQVIVGANGWAALVSQQDDTVYNSIGVDGSTVTEFVPDYPNIQVDISDPDGQTSVDRLYAWFVSTTTTANGIQNWLGGIVAEDPANFRIVTSILNLKLDNIAATGVEFTGGKRLYRDDDLTPLVASTTGGGSITLFAGKVYTSVISTASSVITGTVAEVTAAVRANLTPELARMDVAVSTRTQSGTTVSANVTQVNGITIGGVGTEANPWGPGG